MSTVGTIALIALVIILSPAIGYVYLLLYKMYTMERENHKQKILDLEEDKKIENKVLERINKESAIDTTIGTEIKFNLKDEVYCLYQGRIKKGNITEINIFQTILTEGDSPVWINNFMSSDRIVSRVEYRIYNKGSVGIFVNQRYTFKTEGEAVDYLFELLDKKEDRVAIMESYSDV